MRFPKKTPTLDDVGQQIREQKLILTGVFNDIEIAQRKKDEKVAWMESREESHRKLLSDAKEEVEASEKKVKIAEKALLEAEEKLYVAVGILTETKSERNDLMETIDALEENVADFKKHIKAEGIRLTGMVLEAQEVLDELAGDTLEKKAEVEGYRKELAESGKELALKEETLETKELYLESLAKDLVQKSRDLRLWEMRVKRKVDKHLKIKL